MPSLIENRTAEWSPCRSYRYKLLIDWDKKLQVVNFLMLNPSTADEFKNDPTVAKCCRYAKSWGYGAVMVTNLFALRATDPAVMMAHSEPVGPLNNSCIKACAQHSDLVVCAWGVHGRHLSREQYVLNELLRGIKLHCLATTRGGHPGHPLYLKETLTASEFGR